MANGFTMTISDSPRGTCDICGKPAYAPQAKKCADHRGKAGRSAPPRDAGLRDAMRSAGVDPGPTAPPGSDIRREGGDGGAPEKTAAELAAEAKTSRRKQIAQQMKAELNPALARGFAALCRPVPAVNFYKEEGDKVVPHHFGESVTFDDMEIWVLSYAAAELESSPMTKTVTAVAGPVVPILAMVGAALLIGAKGYQVVNLRQDIITKWKTETAAEAPGQDQHTAARDAAEEAERTRAQAQTVRAEETAQAARASGDIAADVAAQPGNGTRPETMDVDLGVPGEAAVPVELLPDLAGAEEAELAEIMAAS